MAGDTEIMHSNLVMHQMDENHVTAGDGEILHSRPVIHQTDEILFSCFFCWGCWNNAFKTSSASTNHVCVLEQFWAAGVAGIQHSMPVMHQMDKNHLKRIMCSVTVLGMWLGMVKTCI